MPGATSAGQDVARRLTDDGYVVVSGLMTAADVRAAAADLSRVLEAVPTGRNAFEGLSTQRVYALFAKTRTFDRAVVHPLVLEVLDQVLGPLPRPAASDPVETAVMSPGSVMFYLGSLWHGGGANRTGRARLGVILEYAASWLRPQENHCLAVPRDVVRQLPERLQELLGYNIYPPFLGYVDGVHPRRVLSADQ